MAIPRAKGHEFNSPDIAALLISPVVQDQAAFKRLFDEQGWMLYISSSLESAVSLLQERVASVVITEKDLPAGSWRDVLEATRLVPDPPVVIVSSLHADDYLWAEALNLGAYDVLAKPLDTTEVIRVFSSARLHQQHASDKHCDPSGMRSYR